MEHRGITITLNERNGAFSATINGEKESRTSLPALKKAIDKSLETEFKPFTAYRSHRYEDTRAKALSSADVPEKIKVQIVNATEKKNASYYERHKFVTNTGNTLTEALLVDTPTNLAAYLALHNFDKETARISEERKAQHEKLHAKIEWQRAADFFKKPE